MSIGEILTRARREAGRTVTEVSQRTRIRETIIVGIEDDDYSACGGDFYARGHIRSIARAVGIDPEPLIREYDIARLGPEPDPEEVTAPVPRVREPGRHRLAGTVALVVVLVAALCFGVYHLLAGSGHGAAATSAAQTRPAPAHHARHVQSPPPAPTATPTPTPGTTSIPARPLSPARAEDFGVHGPGQGDNPQLAQDAIDGHSGAAWHTDWYSSADLGNLYAGTGLLVDMGKTVTITSAQVTLGSARGADFQLRVGAEPVLADLKPVASAADAAGVARLKLTGPASGRYVLIWFTGLPPDAAGTFEATVRDLQLRGH